MRFSKGKPKIFRLTLYLGHDDLIINWLTTLSESRTSAVRRALSAYVLASQGGDASGTAEALNMAVEMRTLAGALTSLRAEMGKLRSDFYDQDRYQLHRFNYLSKEITGTLKNLTDQVTKAATHAVISRFAEEIGQGDSNVPWWRRLLAHRAKTEEL